jgi:UDP-N-acetylglucosamine 1-carboxyvinyltransferase
MNLEHLYLCGGQPLHGEVRVSGAKNSALPLLIATLLTDQPCILRNVPDLEDIAVTMRLLESLGASVHFSKNTMRLHTPKLTACEARYDLVKRMRASFWVLGPLLARGGTARVALPGGDAIGTRPVDLHLEALSQFGADIRLKNGVVLASAPGKLQPADITLGFPSVGATHHVLLTAALIEGTTVLRGAAREPEIVEVASLLSRMGAEIEGAGTDTIVIRGRSELGGAQAAVLGDRIEAATYLAAAAMTGGKVKVSGITEAALGQTLTVLRDSGCGIEVGEQDVIITGPARLKAVSFATQPYPGLATDVQPVLMAAMAVADGESVIEENVFENRFGHVAEYRRLGADIQIEGRIAKVRGVEKLSGAPVEALDIRAAAGLVLLGLVAQGETVLSEIHHLDRGYDKLVERFTALGANVRRVPQFEAKELVLGC